jgi:predicted transcriptional regulator
MELNINDELKARVLKQLSDGKVYSFYLLSKAVGANNTTVKKNCNFLHLIGLIDINKISAEESASGLPSYRIRITEDGLKAVKNIFKTVKT